MMTTCATAPLMLAGLLPEWIFTDPADVWLWLIACAAVPMLVFGAHRLVDAAVHIAKAMGMSTVLIGATIVSLGTTSPEAIVSVRSAIAGHPEMALGNAVGSIICDTALIFGLCCILAPLPANRFILRRHGWLQLGAGALLVVVAGGAWLISGDINHVYIGRPVGLAFLALLVGYMVLSIHWSRTHPETVPDEAQPDTKRGHLRRRLLGQLAFLLGGLALVVLGSELLVSSVVQLCQRHNVPKAIIAVTLVAFGTSFPELVTAITSLVKGHSELLVGNIIGADILNVLFVAGASATAEPLKVEPVFFTLLFPVMMLVLILLRIFIFTNGKQFRRWQGIPLVVIYVVFTVISVIVFGLGGH